MRKRIANDLNRVALRHWLLFLVMSQTVYCTMLLFSIPRIRREAGGMQLFDMMPLGYSYEYASQFLSRLSAKGYDLYMNVQLPLDLLYPVLNCLTGLCTMALIFRLYKRVNPKSKWTMDSACSLTAVCLPVAAMIADYMENVLIFAMLSDPSPVPETLVIAANLFTIIKSASTAAYYMMILVACMLIGVIWTGKKTRGEPIGGRIWLEGEKDGAAESLHNGRNAPSAQNETAP